MYDNNRDDRGIQQDARAWAKYTGINYTQALRLMRHPLAQGVLGPRISARSLIAVLDEHPVVGHAAGVTLSPSGLDRSDSFADQPERFIDVVLAAEVQRMFRPVEITNVGSYGMKHRAEDFLGGEHSYISNGETIWAAAVLGLKLKREDPESLNVLIGVDEHEVGYLRRLQQNPHALVDSHHRPPGWEHLQAALDAYNAEGTTPTQWDESAPDKRTSDFHEWMLEQVGDDGAVGNFARLAHDYEYGVSVGDHGIAMSPEDLTAILESAAADEAFFEAAYEAGVAFRSLEGERRRAG
ncbi:hypothetical protein [Demequina flava]|uniref:hypothetical protein n=1 Tax=Demequina flava TaxID=1095025 RepID=UPI0007811832|nr:hypothetical protein [Demequina flava]